MSLVRFSYSSPSKDLNGFVMQVTTEKCMITSQNFALLFPRSRSLISLSRKSLLSLSAIRQTKIERITRHGIPTGSPGLLSQSPGKNTKTMTRRSWMFRFGGEDSIIRFGSCSVQGPLVSELLTQPSNSLIEVLLYQESPNPSCIEQVECFFNSQRN